MTKSAVTDWSTDPNANTDIGGINIDEGCPSAGLNDMGRNIMSQFATWLAAAAGPVLKVAGLIANTAQVADGAGTGRLIGYRNIPMTPKTAAYQIALTDVGQGISITTGGITIPTNATTAFAVGDCVAIYNNSASSQNITPAGGVTLRLGGSATTGTRSLAGYGFVLLLKVATDEWSALNGGIA